MKLTSLFILLTTVCLHASGQKDEEYPSKELVRYYKSHKEKNIRPSAKRKVKRFQPPKGISLKASSQQGNTFKTVWNYTDVAEKYIKMRDSCISQYRQTRNPDSYNTCRSVVDSLKFTDQIGNVIRAQIIRMNSKTNPSIILYKNAEFEDNSWGYWIGILKKGRWEYYYTGLAENNYLHLKPKPTIDFQTSKNTLQAEAALVRLKEPGGYGNKAEYELVQDNLIVEFDLNEITKDSDNDRLTDIVELKLGTNPYLNDSDLDGIDDYIDRVPLSKHSNSDIVSLYNCLLNEMTDNCLIKKEDLKPQNKQAKEIPIDQCYLIVSDVEELKAVVSKKSDRLIILTEKEYKKHKSLFPESLSQLYASPLFKVDNTSDTYRVSIGSSVWSKEYLVKKTENEWIINTLTISSF